MSQLAATLLGHAEANLDGALASRDKAEFDRLLALADSQVARARTLAFHGTANGDLSMVYAAGETAHRIEIARQGGCLTGVKGWLRRRRGIELTPEAKADVRAHAEWVRDSFPSHPDFGRDPGGYRDPAELRETLRLWGG